MSVILILLAVGAVLAIVAPARGIGLNGALFAATLATLVLYPQLLSERDPTFHVGIAPPSPELRTFTIAIVVVSGIALISGAPFRRVPTSLVLLPAWGGLAFLAAWSHTPEHV